LPWAAPVRVEVICNCAKVDCLDKGVESGKTDTAREQFEIPPTAFVLGGVFRMSEEKRPRLWLDVGDAVTRRTRRFGSWHAGIDRRVMSCARTP
jgi:hypothetical protein